MKLRQIGMGILLCLISIPCVQAQTYKKLWKQVEQAEEKSLPETVVKLTDVIYRKGEKEKNSPQMLKAYMWRMKYRDIIVPDSFYVGLQGLEQWAQQTDIPMDRAILHSLIAGIYADYVEKNQRQLRDREDIYRAQNEAYKSGWPSTGVNGLLFSWLHCSAANGDAKRNV